MNLRSRRLNSYRFTNNHFLFLVIVKLTSSSSVDSGLQTKNSTPEQRSHVSLLCWGDRCGRPRVSVSAIVELCAPFCDLQQSYYVIAILQRTGSSPIVTESHNELHGKKFPYYLSSSTYPFISTRLVCHLLYESPYRKCCHLVEN